jgi:hypothetical protein
MSLFIDTAFDSLIKYKEELCGDHVEIRKNEKCTIVVLADGLGSGVKANILATLTATIAATMLEQGAGLMAVVETLSQTLPKCKVRNLAYSTFTILQFFNTGELKIIEFDNPQVIVVRDGIPFDLDREKLVFQEQVICESNINIQIGDMIVCISDGIEHAGIGGILNFGWQWDDILKYVLVNYPRCNTAKEMSGALTKRSNDLYNAMPGDDSTAVVVKIREPEIVTLFSGPPKDIEKDKEICRMLKESKGKKIVCGGTAANIVARESGEEIITDLSTISKRLPPVGCLKGIDLVTEGVLTITEANNLIRLYKKNYITAKELKADNGAAKLADMLINHCTHFNVIMGNAVNPAHQNPAFPEEFGIKWHALDQLIKEMRDLGKVVSVQYI